MFRPLDSTMNGSNVPLLLCSLVSDADAPSYTATKSKFVSMAKEKKSSRMMSPEGHCRLHSQSALWPYAPDSNGATGTMSLLPEHVHVVAPAGEDLPAGHSQHPDIPVSELYDPAIQSLHDV
jgi:hypothetical protein